jgi:hypothetical protein
MRRSEVANKRIDPEIMKKLRGIAASLGDLAATIPTQRPLTSAPHTSLYIGKNVQRALRGIALEYDREMHDVLLEGVDMVLQRYRRPTIAELTDSD